MQITVNQTAYTLDAQRVPPDMPLLWVLRDELGLTGTKYGCGVAACGACTVQVDGQAQRACVTPVAAVQGKAVRTIEALAGPGAGADDPAALPPLQAAWLAHQVPQCGYCQSGMLMAADALLRRTPRPSDAEIDAAITNLCRCGTYPRVRAAIHAAAQAMAPASAGKPAPARPGSRA